MKRIVIFLFALALSGMTAQAQGGAQSKSGKPALVVFVVGIDNHQVEDYLASLVGNELARAGKYEVLSRSEAVKRKLAELREYEDSGHVDDRELIAWGRQSNVSAICLVHVVRFDEYLFSAQLTDVRSGKLAGSGEYAIPTASGADLKKAASAIAAQLQRKN
ncbi:MAG: penicillin-binding protein activator LpoB [Prevotellaceae bacterium]|jgi:hypothetical protein|nr:penicillin-binding protein activator LpoB [Prevotellaceae bacterium]